MKKYLYLLLSFFILTCEAKLPNIAPQDVTIKAKEIMKAHASQKKLTPQLAKRILGNYLENLDVNKTYFIESDIEEWARPSNALLQQVVEDYDNHRFAVFKKMQEAFIQA